MKSSFNWIFHLALAMLFLTGCDSSRTIIHDRTETEANEILNVLESKGIQAEKSKAIEAGGGGASKETKWNIVVKEGDAVEAMAILNQSGLPRRPTQNLLNIFANTGLVPSEMAQKIRYQAGLAETLASIIRKMDGVLDAEVQISFPEEDPLNPGHSKDKITASVYVKYSPLLDDPNAHLETKIKRLVSSGVPGLDYNNVTVILDRARFGNIEANANPQVEEKNFVNIWSIVVAQESVSRFRVVFFSFILLILLMLLILGWLAWKLIPALESMGGFKALFSLHPLQVKKKKSADKTPAEGEQKKVLEEPDEGADSEIDET